jgi:hypothetical protein
MPRGARRAGVHQAHLRSVEVHRVGEMVVDLGRQLVADTGTRTAQVRIPPGAALDVPGGLIWTRLF